MILDIAIITANAFTIEKCKIKNIALPKNRIYLDNLTGDCFRNLKNGYAGKMEIEKHWQNYQGICLDLIKLAWDSAKLVFCEVSIEMD